MAAMDYLRAAQPRVVALFLVTVLAALLLGGGLAAWRALAVLAATAVTVGGAAVLNNVIERDVDRRMERTRRRPTASGRIPPARATLVGLLGVAAGAAALWAVAGALAAIFALLGAFYYVVLYTLLLKPRSALSAVPGGVAGVFPALIGWAATGAGWSGAVLWLCVLIPVWSPPHSWALTLALEDEYRSSGLPTPPGRYGDASTRRLIAGFMVLLTAVLAAPLVMGLFGPLYAGGAAVAALLLWAFTLRLLRRAEARAAWALFKVTGPCLALVLAAAVAAHLL
jgi:protoheme IX farnesyltransferase